MLWNNTWTGSLIGNQSKVGSFSRFWWMDWDDTTVRFWHDMWCAQSNLSSSFLETFQLAAIEIKMPWCFNYLEVISGVLGIGGFLL